MDRYKNRHKLKAWDWWYDVMRSTAWLEKHDFALGVNGKMVVRAGNELVLRDHNVFPMLFTGLVCGKEEVYEDYIIEHDLDGPNIGVVRMVNGSYVVENENGYFLLHDVLTKSNAKIIGDRHQHAHLLTGDGK